jgi:predicted tellurium resistance membrane protein TerC
MGLAADFVARLLTRYHWLAWGGIAIVFYVAVKMIWEGSGEVFHALG